MPKLLENYGTYVCNSKQNSTYIDPSLEDLNSIWNHNLESIPLDMT